MILKLIYIYDTTKHGKKTIHSILTQLLQQSMAFLGETSSQKIVNSKTRIKTTIQTHLSIISHLMLD